MDSAQNTNAVGPVVQQSGTTQQTVSNNVLPPEIALAALDTFSAGTSPLESAASLTKTPNPKRYTFYQLKKGHGFFLTRLDEQGKILSFLAGAMRTEVDNDTDEVAIVTPHDIVRGMDGDKDGRSFIPVPKIITLRGEDKRKLYPAKFESSAYFEYMITTNIPEGAMWGLLYIHPSNSRHRMGVTYQGDNHEELLDPNTWRPLTDSHNRIIKHPAGGGSDFAARLHEKAIDYVSTMPSVWRFASDMSLWFGGMSNHPRVVGLENAVVHRIVARENALRAQKEAEAEMRKARARIERRAHNRVEGFQVGAGGSPAANVLWQMEDTIKTAGAGDTPTGE